MTKEVKWTKEAEESFDKIIIYLTQKWTKKEVDKFIKATEKVISYIAEQPLMFRKSEKKHIHEALVTKHNLLLYRVRKEHIEILTFWDTRKNPRKKFHRKK